MTAWCMKCHSERKIKDAKVVKMKNGNIATKGLCAVCGTRVFRIGKDHQTTER